MIAPAASRSIGSLVASLTLANNSSTTRLIRESDLAVPDVAAVELRAKTRQRFSAALPAREIASSANALEILVKATRSD